MIRPVSFCMRNNPYEYCYFNEIAGNFKEAFYNYDNDYWEISIKKSLDRLIENEHLVDKKDSVILATNAYAFAKYYVPRHYPKAKIIIISSGAGVRNSLNWQYAVFNSIFLKPDYLENYFPPANYIYAENIDDMPVSVGLKDTIRLDNQANAALRLAHHHIADSLFNLYIKTTKDDNPGLYGVMSIAKASILESDVAITYANKCLRYHLSPLCDYNSYCGLGIAYANKRNFAMTIENLKMAQKLLPAEGAAKDILMQVYQLQKQVATQH